MGFCIDCGTSLAGAFCGQCGRRANDDAPVAGRVDRSARIGAAVRADTGQGLGGAASYAYLATDGRRCVPCAAWIAGAGRCPSCGGLGAEADDDVGRAAADAAASHVRAVDRSVRGGSVRAALSGDDMAAKVVLTVLALIGVAIAVNSVAGFVFVAAVAVLAVVPTSIAQSRGRQPLPWYVYGALLFPLAVGHALMLPTLVDGPGATAGDRQLRALVGGAAALFIALGVGLITNELAASSVQDDDGCYELASEANTSNGAAERSLMLREAAACLEGR